MTSDATRQRELLLIEILQAALDLRQKAETARAPMLLYLSNLIARRARTELEVIDRSSLNGPSED